jgi:hypothetical protein
VDCELVCQVSIYGERHLTEFVRKIAVSSDSQPLEDRFNWSEVPSLT